MKFVLIYLALLCGILVFNYAASKVSYNNADRDVA